MNNQLKSATIPSIESLQLPKRGMPVTIITGFLGSGKTTLLNHILQSQHQKKIAVLVNEFGDINIDSELLMSIDEDMVELSNGCICCTINEDLVEATYRILERDDKVDHLVIETTGVADPLPIILTFLGSDLRDLTRLDAVITLVDSETYTPEHFQSSAAFNQVTYGDIVILNKTDLAEPDKVTQLEDWIIENKAGARILKAQQSIVPLNFLLDTEQFSAQAYQKELQEAHTSHHHHGEEHHHDHAHHHHEEGHHHDHSHHHHEEGHEHHHSDHLENDGFVSISFESDRPFSLEKFQEFLTDVMTTDIFRAKGFLWFPNIPTRYIFQLSGGRYTLDNDTWPSQPKIQLVFIGRHLNSRKLQSQLKACLAR